MVHEKLTKVENGYDIRLTASHTLEGITQKHRKKERTEPKKKNETLLRSDPSSNVL